MVRNKHSTNNTYISLMFRQVLCFRRRRRPYSPASAISKRVAIFWRGVIHNSTIAFARTINCAVTAFLGARSRVGVSVLGDYGVEGAADRVRRAPV